MEICKTECDVEHEGKHICCAYCEYKQVCGNPCDNSPYKCGNILVSDSKLLDYVLDKHLNMDKTELVVEYLKINKEREQ